MCVFVSPQALAFRQKVKTASGPVHSLVHGLDSVGDGYGGQIDTAHVAACSRDIHDGVVGVW